MPIGRFVIKRVPVSPRRQRTMKAPRNFSTLLLGLALICGSANAVTFNTNTYIGPTDVTYESQDIEVTNCTVTVDGAHSFTSLRIENAGIVTHSFSSNGLLLSPITVPN